MSIPLFMSRKLISVIITICLIGLLTTQAWAQEARLTDIAVTSTRDHMLVYFTVSDCITAEMKKAIENGINTTFTFFIRLYEVKEFDWDNKIADVKVSHDIQYESLKKIYTVRLSEKDNKTVSVQDFDKARKLMSEIVGLKVTDLHNLHKGKRYQVRMMAELDKIRLPFYLHYVFFFLSLWDFETAWYSVDFKY